MATYRGAMTSREPPARARVIAAVAVAAVVSGAPSTAHAFGTGRDPLAATRAAASLAGLPTDRAVLSVLSGGAVHVVVSCLWGTVLVATLPAGRRGRWGLVAGALIWVLDLGIIARVTRRVAIMSLPQVPQLADHLAFAGTVGVLLDRWTADRH